MDMSSAPALERFLALIVGRLRRSAELKALSIAADLDGGTVNYFTLPLALPP